jgi:hypothetical protein
MNGAIGSLCAPIIFDAGVRLLWFTISYDGLESLVSFEAPPDASVKNAGVCLR